MYFSLVFIANTGHTCVQLDGYMRHESQLIILIHKCEKNETDTLVDQKYDESLPSLRKKS